MEERKKCKEIIELNTGVWMSEVRILIINQIPLLVKIGQSE